MTKGNPFLVNIESKKKFTKKKKKSKTSLKMNDAQSSSSDSVIKADQVAIMEPVLQELKKSLMDDKRKAKSKSKSKNKWKRMQKKSGLYSHVKSKVAQSINGRVPVKNYWRRRRFKRKAKSETRSKRRSRTKARRAKSIRVKSVKAYRKKTCKKKAKSKIVYKKGLKTEAISESGYSVKPLNIRTEVAVKLFPEKKNKDIIGSVWTKASSKRRSTAKSQSSWLKRNAMPRKSAISEYERFEKIFIHGKSERMDILDHSVNLTK